MGIQILKENLNKSDSTSTSNLRLTLNFYVKVIRILIKSQLSSNKEEEIFNDLLYKHSQRSRWNKYCRRRLVIMRRRQLLIRSKLWWKFKLKNTRNLKKNIICWINSENLWKSTLETYKSNSSSMRNKSKKFLKEKKSCENLTLSLKIECGSEKSIFIRLNIRQKLETNILRNLISK